LQKEREALNELLLNKESNCQEAQKNLNTSIKEFCIRVEAAGIIENKIKK